MYDKNTIYILGTSKISKSDPIGAFYDILFVGIILERPTGKIIDCTCNMVRDITSEFIRSILVGYELENDLDCIIEEIKNRFYGMAQKSVIAAVKDAKNKYTMIQNHN